MRCSGRGSGILPLSIDGVSVSLAGRRVLDNISLTIPQGERTVVLGPNGAGKTTLLRLCHGLLPPDSGELDWQGPEAIHRRQRQAMVFQRPVMLRRSVRANIAHGLKVRRVARRERRARVDEVLEATGLEDFATRPARRLSIGEQQRVAIARAWALAPEVLFLDEPTASLDPGATRAVEILVGLISRAGTTVVLTTQDLAQARRLADRVVFFHGGRALEMAAAESFFARPRSPEARAFIAGDLFWSGAPVSGGREAWVVHER